MNPKPSLQTLRDQPEQGTTRPEPLAGLPEDWTIDQYDLALRAYVEEDSEIGLMRAYDMARAMRCPATCI